MKPVVVRLALVAAIVIAPACRKLGPMPPREVDADVARVGRALIDVRILAVAMEAILVDRGAYPESGEKGIRVGQFVLVPAAILGKRQPSLGPLPSVDPWGHPYLLWSSGRAYVVVCTGSDGVIGSGRPLEDLLHDLSGKQRFEVSGETSCVENEIVLADGQLAQWPGREATRCGTPPPDTEPSRIGLQTPEADQPPPDADRLVQYYRRKANVSPGTDVRVTGLRQAPVAGMMEGTLQVGVARVPFTVSADGRYASFLPLEDVTADPFAAIVRKISLVDVPARGPASAPVTIVEYGDFQCPFSARAYATIENQVLKQYPDTVRFVFKQFPLAMHPWAELGAIAAECAKKQRPEAFWAVYRGLFENQQTIGPGNLQEKVRGFLAGSGIDTTAVDACIDEKRTLPAVKAQVQEAAAVGVTGTPAFLINGRLIAGAQPYENFKVVIDEELEVAAEAQRLRER